MPVKRDEEFEIVLGNKQLLSLFFVIVVFFAAFFSIGYSVGFNHGEGAEPTPEQAATDAEAPEVERVPLPEALLADASDEAAAPAAAARAAGKPAAENRPAIRPAEKAATPPPAAPPPAPKPNPATAAAPSGTYYLQVAAVRVGRDAELLASKLRSKQYPANVRNGSDGWHRVVVGPYTGGDQAKPVKGRLKADGFEPMLRRFR